MFLDVDCVGEINTGIGVILGKGRPVDRRAGAARNLTIGYFRANIAARTYVIQPGDAAIKDIVVTGTIVHQHDADVVQVSSLTADGDGYVVRSVRKIEIVPDTIPIEDTRAIDCRIRAGARARGRIWPGDLFGIGAIVVGRRFTARDKGNGHFEIAVTGCAVAAGLDQVGLAANHRDGEIGLQRPAIANGRIVIEAQLRSERGAGATVIGSHFGVIVTAAKVNVRRTIS